VINDTFRSELCLLYPPHLIAIAAIYLTLVLHIPTHAAIINQDKSPPQSQQTTPQPRRSSRQAIHAALETAKKPTSSQDPISFLSELNVSLPLIATIAQEIISMYALWDRYKEDPAPDSAKPTFTPNSATPPIGSGGSNVGESKQSASASGPGSMKSHSHGGTPAEITGDSEGWNAYITNGSNNVNVVTPAFLATMLMRMREAKWTDMAQTRLVAVNKMLERTQAAG
jgi:cyclin C